MLAGLPPLIYVLPADTPLWRVYARGGPYATAWDAFRAYGPTGERFDHHIPPARAQDRRILYAATSALTSLAEYFQATRTINTRRRQPWLVGFRTTSDLRLLDLRSVWPTRAGGSMAINTGRRDLARAWSREIHAVYPDVHGLWYASSMHAGEPAVALYERAELFVEPQPMTNRALADPLLRDALRRAAATLGYRFYSP
ncbi:MAG: RES domain-containing protein [Chloroflexota bacterium]|nr:MAG: RES domain-containing protein [Chloroflexota bacterium]